jgi:hypothetical protein
LLIQLRLIEGAGSNFGVVTEFTFQGHPHPGTVYSGLLIYDASQIVDLVEAWGKWVETGWGPKTAGMIMVGCPPGSAELGVVANLFYDGPEEEGRKLFKPFFDANPRMDLTQVRPYVEQVSRSQMMMLTLECVVQ